MDRVDKIPEYAKMKSKKLIAGPWVGEFGWELFAWQAYIRSLSDHYDKTTIICRESSRALYSDFASQFLYYEPSGRMADSFFMHGLDLDQVLNTVLMENKNILEGQVSILKPRRVGSPPFTNFDVPIRLGNHDVIPKYISFGNLDEIKYDYVFHIRQRKLREQDNWKLEKWEKLCDLLTSDGSNVICIGTKMDSGILPRATDMRNADLQDVFNVLKNAKCAFGPSSGPMHLASLCGCPHVVWSSSKNYKRYTETWNPLGTPVLFLHESAWQPPPEYVYKEYLEWSREK